MKRKAFIYIILSGIFWGSSGLFVHSLAPLGLSAIQITSARGIVSAALMSLYVFITDRACFKVTKKELFMFFCSGAAILLTSGSYFASMQASSVSTAVVLMYTAPIIVMVYSVLFMGEKFTRLKLAALVFMIAGCALVSGVAGGLKFSTRGIILGFLSGFAYSAYNILTKMQMKQRCNPVSASMYCFIFMAAISLFISNPAHIVSVAAENPQSVLIMLGCGVVTCVLPYFLYTLALKVLPVGTAASLGIIEPLSATVLSVTVLNEALTWEQSVGIILIISAVFMLSRTKE